MNYFKLKLKRFLMKKITLILATIFVVTVGYSQKIGHMNAGNLMAQMPEVAKADSVVKIYQKDLTLKGDTLAKAFEKEYKAFVDAYNAGTLSSVEAQKRQEYLQKQQNLLQTYAQDSDNKVATLRQQLLQPIIAKMDDAIRAVAKENSYTIIFDTSAGSTLFAQDSDDITSMVKKKLGMN
jgi:outer membrane protein